MAERLTDRGITALKPSDKSTIIFDSEVAGLAVRIYPSGKKSFIFDWRHLGRQRRITFGSPPAWTIGKARLHASKLRLKADTGESITPARGERVVDLIERWREVVAVTRRRSTIKSYSRHIDRRIIPAFGASDPRTITRNAIEEWHGSIAQKTPIEANRALATLAAFLGWCEHDGKVERNMAQRIKRRPESPRQVFLDANEIEAAHAALDRDVHRPAALALRLALLTGARIGEVLSLTADQIDLSRKLWTKPHHLTKQRKAHLLPLQGEAMAIVEALLRLEMPSYDACFRAWSWTRQIIGRPDVKIHDLRHSRASSLARSGASLPMIGRVLGHASPATTQKYLHLVDRDLVDLIERSR